MDKNKEITLDELATIIQKEFHNVNEKLDVLERGLNVVERGLDIVKQGQKDTNEKLIMLERGQEDLKLRQDNVPYRFELKEQNEVLDDHAKRIRTLEKKILLANSV